MPSDWGLSFGYDIWGNLLNQTVTKGSAYPLSVAANTNNQIIGFCYDAAGNLTHQGACPGSSYTYDAENRLTATGGVTYTYDGDGKRVKKSNGTLYWHGAGGEVLAETDLSGVLKREYIYFNGSRVARHDPGGNWFYFADHLGSARVMTWQNGIPVEESDYYPFGGERVIQDTVGPPWDNTNKFTGQLRDTESGLDYFLARHYASPLARFLQPDPLLNSGRPSTPQSWNRYTYAFNNPLKFVDPTGLYNLVNTCAQDDDKCNKKFAKNAERLKKSVEKLEKAIDKVKDPVEKARLQASLKALGKENDGNNVNVTFGPLKGDAAGQTDLSIDGSGKLTFNVTFDPSRISSTDDMAIDAAHEGTHVADISNQQFNDPRNTLTNFQKEYRGYQTSAWAASALGWPSLSYRGGQYMIWNRSWGAVDDKVLTQYITSFKDEKGQQTHPDTKPNAHNPWPN